MDGEVTSQGFSGRSKRVLADKTGRFAALEKLKQLKGSKHKYEVKDENPVYEELNEKEFSRLVKQRQEDDWIVDDDGCGYVEDGREIFDDDDINDDAFTSKQQSRTSKKKYEPPQKRNIKKLNDIKSLFQAQPTKRKAEEVKLEDDEILGAIMKDIHNGSDTLPSPKPYTLKKKPKLKNCSPKKRFSNPFSVRQISPLNVETYSSRSQNVQNNVSHVVPTKHLQPKVINFDNRESESSGVLEDHVEEKADIESVEVETKTLKAQNYSNMEFDDDTDVFDGVEDSIDITKEVIDETQDIVGKNIIPASAEMGFIGNAVNDIILPNVVVPDVHVDASHLPIITLPSGDPVLRFFWFDAFEDRYKQPGVVYLFGKVFLKSSNAHVSCCVIVKNISRRIYILPRETHFDMRTKKDLGKPVTMQDVYAEFSSLAGKMKITEFKTKKTTKRYAFSDSDIPDKCEYLEVQYSARFQPIPSDISGSTFSHVLGTDTSSLEMLLLDQKMKGPGWLDIYFPQGSNPPVSWCKLEVVATKMQHVVPSQDSSAIPPLVVACISLTTSINSSSQQNEIAAISCLSHHQFPLNKPAPIPPYQTHFCALTKPSDCIFPYDFKDALTKYKHTKVERLDSERALLAFFLAKIHKMDPDVIIGHDVIGFDLDVLLHRISTNKVPNWSKIGRLRRSGAPRLGNSNNAMSEKNATCGRLLCDIKISAKELIRCKSYDLVELVSHVLQQKRTEIPIENVKSFYSSSQLLLQLVDHGMKTADMVLRIGCELNILPLALQITTIAGCVLSRTLLGGRSERNEYLLLHAFHEKNFICPPKFAGKKPAKFVSEDAECQDISSNQQRGRRKPAYAGGLVLEPRIGFYDKFILLMDFNSLYPSIIQEYNICFTTIDRVSSAENEKEQGDIPQVSLPEPGLEPGILPTEIRKLVESRKQVKVLMKSDLSTDRYTQYDIRQRALKLTANSMYGCLGFSHSRFYAKALAALVTLKGREILMKTKELVEKMGLDVVYGDTDSIMINTNILDFDEVNQIGNKVKVEVNKLYKQLEIDIDGVYKPMLLFRKKKYAALAVTRLSTGQMITREEMKGLDIVRRDWSQLAKSAGEYVIKKILSTKSKEDILDDIHSHLIALGEDVKSGKKPISDFNIVKQLTKNPEEYPDKKNLPHVLVALRINQKSGRKMKQGDTVPYVICEDGSNLPVSQRAYHPDELNSNENLKIDVSYYLSQQVHPVVSRLCNPIEGTDAAAIAKFLGLNPDKYVSSTRDQEADDKFFTSSSSFNDKDRFKDCDKLELKCPNEECNKEILIDQALEMKPTMLTCKLSVCPNTNCNAKLYNHSAALCNQVVKIMRHYISKYYQNILVCEDTGCAYRTKKMSLIFTSGGPLCPYCCKANLLPEYTESQLYLQLAYFGYLFDLKKAELQLSSEEKAKLKVYDEDQTLYYQLKSTVDRKLQASSYGVINLSSLFQGLFRPAKEISQ